MKKLTLLFGILISINTFGQSGAAYKQLQAPKNNLNQSLQYWGNINARNNQINAEAAARRREKNSNSFNNARNNGILAFNNQKYSKCIYFYEGSKDLGWYDSNFELVAGVSYFRLYQQLGKKKYKKKAKKILKKSKKHGNIDAELFLDKYF